MLNNQYESYTKIKIILLIIMISDNNPIETYKNILHSPSKTYKDL